MAETLGLVSSIITVVELFGKIAVHCSVYCADMKSASSEVRQIIDEASRLGSTLNDVERLLDGPNGASIGSSPNIQRTVDECKTQMKELDAKLERGTILNKIKWPLNKGEVAAILHKMQRYRQDITLNLQVNQTALIHDVHQDFILAKLRTVEQATFDSQTEAGNKTCYAGTRTEILDQIMAWGSTNDGECIFWLNGKAGTGKSTISRTASQRLESKGMLGASFFFKRGEGDRGRAIYLFPTLIAQLVHHVPALAPYVRDEIERNPGIHDKAIKQQFDKLISTPISKLPDSSPRRKLVVVIDALDECDDLDHIRLILHLFSETKHFKALQLRFLLTSRPELPIRLGFEDIRGKYEDVILDEIPQPIIEKDISIFLKYELARIRDDYNKFIKAERQLPPDWPGQRDLQRLVNMSIPLFIFAATACLFIQDRRLGGPKNQLAGMLERQGLSELDRTYVPVLDRLLYGLHSARKQEVVERFSQVVGSIVILADPLSTTALSRLLGISLDSVEDQLSLLHSVLNVPVDSNAPVKLLHLSFRDFLVDPEKRLKPKEYPFNIDETKIHQRLAEQCLKLLFCKDNLRRDICGLRKPGKPRSEIAMSTIQAELPPEVQYACRYWIYHLKAGNSSICDGSLVDRFLTRHLLHWLEALSIIGCISESIDIVHDLLDLLNPAASNKMGLYLDDIRRFILTNHALIDAYPLQVYHSGLIYAPEKSIVRKVFSNQLPTWISQLPVMNLNWNACLMTLEASDGNVGLICFSLDSRRLASVHEIHIRVWDAMTGRLLHTLGDCLPETPDLSDSFSETSDLSGVISALSFSPDGKRLFSYASTETHGEIQIWDTATGCRAKTISIGCCHCPAHFSHNSAWIAIIAGDDIELWDIDSSTCFRKFGIQGWHLSHVAFTPDDSRLISSSYGGIIKVWDTANGACMQTLPHNRASLSPFACVAVSHDGRFLASGSRDDMKIWDITTGTYHQTMTSPGRNYSSVAFSPDDSWLVSKASKCLWVWDTKSGECIQALLGHKGIIKSVSISPDGTRMASGSSDRTVKIWDAAFGRLSTAPDGDSDGGMNIPRWVTTVKCSLAVSPDGSMLASYFRSSNSVNLWDTMSGDCLNTVRLNWVLDADKKSAVTISHDKSRLLMRPFRRENEIHIWDIAAGTCIRKISLVGGSSNRVGENYIDWHTLSPDDNWLAMGFSKTICVWDTGSGACLMTFNGHDDSVNCGAFSRDKARLASGSIDKTVKIWDTSDGTCLSTIQHQDSVRSVCFSQDMRFVASTTGWAITIWGPTGLSFLEPKAYLNTLRFSEDDQYLVTDFGSIAWKESLNSHSASVPSKAQFRGYGLSPDKDWITWNGENVLWIPFEHRRESDDVVISSRTLMFAMPDCRYQQICFSPDEDPPS
ncbi:unnamed protein product [Clonostachys rosea]|uniref:Intraflagellar transport protein 122 homolog n=1 Tax=Bionectria ochroleuca TaxID=29856 RepID=A0ABY6UUW6_BIOOC|nr:unnamed protein product [Clonostachys rosea]